jgi:hypothetical protein
VASVIGTGLPSAVDGAREADGTLLRCRKMGGKEMGKDVGLGLGEVSGRGPVAEDGGSEEEGREGEGPWIWGVGPGGGERFSGSCGRHEEAGSALATTAASTSADSEPIGRGVSGLLVIYMAGGRGRCGIDEQHGEGVAVAPCRRVVVEAVEGSGRSRGPSSSKERADRTGNSGVLGTRETQTAGGRVDGVSPVSVGQRSEKTAWQPLCVSRAGRRLMSGVDVVVRLWATVWVPPAACLASAVALRQSKAAPSRPSLGCPLCSSIRRIRLIRI